MVGEMLRLNVSNPTGRKKAVREAGGLTIIGLGETVSVLANWTEEEAVRYETAGLVLSGEAEPVTREDINAMEKPELIELLEAHGADVDKRKGEDALRELAVATLFVNL